MGILSSRQRMAAAAVIMAASAFLSRLMGLARDKIISWQFGATDEADMYFAAFVVPDIINYLLAGGFISITIIPLLARGFENDENEAWRFFSCIFLWMLAASCALTGLGEIFAEKLAAIVAPGFSEAQRHRLAFFMRIILPAQIFFLSGSCFTALLLLRRQFTAPGLTPLIYNGSIILAGLLVPYLAPASTLGRGMTGYCLGVTLGAAIGAFVLPFIVAGKGGLRIQIIWLHPWLKKFLWFSLPLMLGQTVVMLDEQFLRIFGSMLGEGSVSLLNYARRIAQVPVALMGQAIAVASYPFLVTLLARKEYDRFDKTLSAAFRAGLFLIIPVSVWMLTAALPILGIIFQGGRFGPAETMACAPLTQLMLAPASLWIIYMVLARAFYAHEDTFTPALAGTVITAACVPFYISWAVRHGTWAIAALSGAGILAYVAWLMAIWIKRWGCGAFEGVGSIAARSLACSLPAGFASWLALNHASLPFHSYSDLAGYCLSLLASACAFAACFLPPAWFLMPDMIKNALRMLARKKKT